MPSGLRTTLISATLVLMLLTGIAACYVPHFFAYADKPAKSDAIIVFLGAEDRKQEGCRLLDEGYARFLIIPASKQFFTAKDTPGALGAFKDRISKGFTDYPRFYEKTHLEVLYAKKMMNTLGLRSAILVSSPYHMKRIRIIAERVFGEQARLFSYVPSPYEHSVTDLRNMDRPDVSMAIMEFIKICWFRLYSPFF